MRKVPRPHSESFNAFARSKICVAISSIVRYIANSLQEHPMIEEGSNRW